MWYRVLVDHAAVGCVDLPPRRIAAGRMTCESGYDRIAPRVRAASRVLLAHGIYGPPISAHLDRQRRRARVALAAAASLRVKLVPLPGGEAVATVFVNLIESTIDGGVVVVALFDDAPATIAAADRREAIPDAAGRPWPGAPVVRRRAARDRSGDE